MSCPCGAPSEDNRKWCGRCAAATNRRVNRWRARNRLAGRCTFCAEPARPGRALCHYHYEYQRDERAAVVARSLCVKCRRPRNLYRHLCDACQTRFRERHDCPVVGITYADGRKRVGPRKK